MCTLQQFETNYEMESISKIINVQTRTNFDQFKKPRKNYIDSQLFDLDGIHVKNTFRVEQQPGGMIAQFSEDFYVDFQNFHTIKILK